MLKEVDYSYVAARKLLLEPDAKRLDVEDPGTAAPKSFSGARFKSKASWWPFAIFNFFFIES